MEGKVAVFGGEDFVMPFSALGLDTYAVEAEASSVVATAREIIGKRYVLVVMAENVATLAGDVFDGVQKKAVPCVVVVPFARESEGFATKALGKVLKMATGIDILSN
jgi:vacuolar-type H+-ATPase subunit F/Vma7